VTHDSGNTTAASGADSCGERLWDRESSLWEAAQTVRLCKPIPPGDPLGERMWAVAGTGTAPNLSTQEMKITLWGPPDQLTLSLGKTDVWDRRTVEQPLFTLDHVKQAYAAGETPPADHYTGWQAYDYPCPKPVGQVIVRVADLQGAPQPTAVVHCRDGSTQVEMEHGGARAKLTCLPMMTRNVIAVSAECIEGHVTFVRLHARRDETCRVMNPWQGAAVTVRDETAGAAVAHHVDEQRGQCIVFPARAGHGYAIEPGS